MKKRKLHLELTSKCALKCPACPRTIFEGRYPVTQMSLDVIERILTTKVEFSQVLLCGDHGDPIYHTEFHAILKRLKALPSSPPVVIATNGSHRDERWWIKTAENLAKKDAVIFGVDGLEKNNHLYRRGADWKSIENGIKTLRANSDCSILWQWILFNYNQGDLKAAALQAKEWGVDQFVLVRSFRDIGPEMVATIDIEQARQEFLSE